MACLAGPSRYDPTPQGQHDITNLAKLDMSTPATRMWDLQDSVSLASEASEASNQSYPSPRPKDQMRRCLHRYKTLALHTLDTRSAKEAVLWCCLGLSIASYSLQTSSSPAHSPLSAESRSNSNGSIGSVSDSGFAPSVEASPRHCMSIADPDIEITLTNLVAGLAGLFVSRSFDRADGSCGVPAEVGHEFDSTLAKLSLAKDQHVDVVLLATKIATQLLNLIQNELGNSQSHMAAYWEQCLKLVAASTRGDLPTADTLASELEKRTPPPSLTEPALSLLRHHETKHTVPFYGLDPTSKFPHTSHRMSRQTRSRAASLMSHSSLCSFSSVRSLGNLSPKSPATLSLSRGISFSQSPTEEMPPAGSFVVGPPRGSMDYLSRALNDHSQRASAIRRGFSLDSGHATTAPSSPLRPTVPTFSRSGSSGSDVSKPRNKGKGKENMESTALGLRPGAEGISSRTGTRFVMTCPPTPSGSSSRKPLPKLDPALAALERGSKFKRKSLCLNCGTKGDNYPCCPRCGETWCSRECRIEANNGGKHVCKRTAPTPSAPAL